MGPNWEELIAIEETKQKKVKFRQFTNRRSVASISWLSKKKPEEALPNEQEPEEALPKAKPEAKPKVKAKQSWPLSDFGPKEDAKAQAKTKAQAKEKDNPKAKPNQILHISEALPHPKPKASAFS